MDDSTFYLDDRGMKAHFPTATPDCSKKRTLRDFLTTWKSVQDNLAFALYN